MAFRVAATVLACPEKAAGTAGFSLDKLRRYASCRPATQDRQLLEHTLPVRSWWITAVHYIYFCQIAGTPGIWIQFLIGAVTIPNWPDEETAAVMVTLSALVPGGIRRSSRHKREDVLDYLPHRHRAMFRRKLQAAYEEPTYEKAKRALSKIRAELVLLNASAANSLDEGLEETLTLHRLGVFAELGTSLKTTNALESIHARVESRTAKVDHWKNSEQKQRWLATALLDLEPRLRRIRNYRALPLLRNALRRQMEMKKSAA
jgi:hypothetical protein